MGEQLDWHEVDPLQGKGPARADVLFDETLKTLQEENPAMAALLEGLSPNDREQFDQDVLNPTGLTWSAFNFMEEEQTPQIVESIQSWLAESDRTKRKDIAKRITKLLQ